MQSVYFKIYVTTCKLSFTAAIPSAHPVAWRFIVPVIQNTPGLPEAAGLSVRPPRWPWLTCRAQLPGRTPKPPPAATGRLGRSRASLPRPPPPGGGALRKDGRRKDLFSFFLGRLSCIFILSAVFPPRAAPGAGPCGCCLPAAAAGNGGGPGPAPGRACRPYVRPLCKRPAGLALLAPRGNGALPALRSRSEWRGWRSPHIPSRLERRRAKARGEKGLLPWSSVRRIPDCQRALPAGGEAGPAPGLPRRCSGVGRR